MQETSNQTSSVADPTAEQQVLAQLRQRRQGQADPVRIAGLSLQTKSKVDAKDDPGAAIRALRQFMKEEEGTQMNLGSFSLSPDSAPMQNAFIQRQNMKALRDRGELRFRARDVPQPRKAGFNEVGKDLWNRSPEEATKIVKRQYRNLLDQGFFPEGQKEKVESLMSELQPGQYIRFQFDKRFGLIPLGIGTAAAAQGGPQKQR